MLFLRTARALPTSFIARGSLISRTTLPASTSAFSTTTVRPSGSDYGSGDANTQTSRSKATKDAEHPGPAPPSTDGKGSSSSSSSSSGGKEASKEGGSEKSGDKPQPKILNTSPPKEGEESEDVKKHNEEMKKRADKPVEKTAGAEKK
jgi:hypothetical protein